MMGTLDNRFRKVRIEEFPRYGRQETNDALYWKDLQFPISIQESGPISCLDMTLQDPYYVAITGSSRIQIYNPITNEVVKSLNKFKTGCFGGRFRRDGQLICAGEEDGSIKIFDFSTKTQLRNLSGHSSSVHRTDFLGNQKHLVSFSDDTTVKIWDISSQETLSSFEEHSDYVRSGKGSPVSSDIFASGSYDHTIKLWDQRTSTKSNFTLDHGYPIEDLLFFPNGSLLVSAGGPKICVWDLISGGALLTSITPHSKTITALGFATNSTRLVSSSLDRQIKFIDVRDFKIVHSLSFPSPLLSLCISSDDRFVSGGSVDGLVQFHTRKHSVSPRSRRKEKYRNKNKRNYLYNTNTSSFQNGDIIIQDEKDFFKETRHDYYLRKFEYSKALDCVLKPYVQKKHSVYTYSVLQELERRNGLRQAFAGRSEKSLRLLLTFLSRNIIESKYSGCLIRVSEVLLEVLGPSTLRAESSETTGLLYTLLKRIGRELRNQRALMELRGALSLIISASKGSSEPSLRVEESNLIKRQAQSNKVVSFSSQSKFPTTLEKLLLVSK